MDRSGCLGRDGLTGGGLGEAVVGAGRRNMEGRWNMEGQRDVVKVCDADGWV